jgi:hypothetical protein
VTPELLAEAKRELATKSRETIERETAWKWAARAVAAYQLLQQTTTYSWLRDFEHYFDEAVEHAALADRTGALLQQVRAWVTQYTAF